MDKAEKNIYDEKYYNSHCGQEYKRNNGWKKSLELIQTG